MPATKTRREKVAAMANQSASPEEAKVAASKLATMEKPRLETIAEDIRAEWGKGIDAQFAIGHKLAEAWGLLNQSKPLFGKWLDEQGFDFPQHVAYGLRVAAGRESEVRLLLANHAAGLNGKKQEITITTAVRKLNAEAAGPKPGTGEVLPVTDTTPVHRAYDAMRTAHRLLVTESGFEDMHVDDMTKVAGFITDIVEAYKAERGNR